MINISTPPSKIDNVTIGLNALKQLYLKDTSITTAKLVSPCVTTIKVADGNITTGKITAANITTDKLKTATGEVSYAASHSFSLDIILPGGEYGFYPQIKTAAGGDGYWSIGGMATVGGSSPGTSYKTNIMMGSDGTYTLLAQQRYVTASGEDWWIFLLIDKDTKGIISAYSAADHPAYGNGGDFEKIPHPFNGYDPIKYDIVLLDKETVAALKLNSEQTGKSILTLVHDGYKPNIIKEEAYHPLHSGKFLTEDIGGEQVQVKHLIESIPEYIKVRKLINLTEKEKAEKEIIRQQKSQEAQDNITKENLIKAKMREQAILALQAEGKL